MAVFIEKTTANNLKATDVASVYEEEKYPKGYIKTI